MEQRKIQITGGNSYIVSLPREWVLATGLSKGDYVGVETNEDGSISVYPKAKERKKRRFVIELTESPTLNNRLLISKYLEGYDVIELVSNERIQKDVRKEIIHTVQNLIGIEIFEETSNKFVLSTLIDFGSIRIEKILRRMIILTSSIFSESLQALSEGNVEFAQEIIPREDEVDKFYFHGIRELAEASRTPQILKDMGINRSTDILSYLTILKSIERISDYLIDILGLFIDSGNEVPTEVSAFGTKCNTIFKDVTDNLFTKDLKKANTFLDSLKDEEANVPKITKLEDASLKGVTSYSKMVDYYLRITRHCANISELTINLAV
jgi:phosphate uptake regulator